MDVGGTEPAFQRCRPLQRPRCRRGGRTSPGAPRSPFIPCPARPGPFLWSRRCQSPRRGCRSPSSASKRGPRSPPALSAAAAACASAAADSLPPAAPAPAPPRPPPIARGECARSRSPVPFPLSRTAGPWPRNAWSRCGRVSAGGNGAAVRPWGPGQCRICPGKASGSGCISGSCDSPCASGNWFNRHKELCPL